MGLEVRAFGSMEIVREGVDTRVRAPRQQALLAMLLVRRGGVVPVSALAEVLWPGVVAVHVGCRSCRPVA